MTTNAVLGPVKYRDGVVFCLCVFCFFKELYVKHFRVADTQIGEASPQTLIFVALLSTVGSPVSFD